MIIYDKVKRFNSITGKPTEEWAFKEIRCDFTGVVLGYENHYCAYDLNYQSQDPCFGSSGGAYQFGKDFNSDMFPFLSQTYHFSVGGSDTKEDFAEWQMLEGAMKNCTNKKSEWYHCYTFDAICRQSRIKTAQKLIENNEIISEQLEDHR
jgi:hypothetical protein